MKTVEELLEQYRYKPEIPITKEEQERMDAYLFRVNMWDYVGGNANEKSPRIQKGSRKHR